MGMYAFVFNATILLQCKLMSSPNQKQKMPHVA